MIQRWFLEECKTKYPEFIWGLDVMPSRDDHNGQPRDHVGGVIYSGGNAPDRYESGRTEPGYQIFIESTKPDFLETVAIDLQNLFHGRGFFDVHVPVYNAQEVQVNAKHYKVLDIAASTSPIPLDTQSGYYQYSLNFDTVIHKLTLL